MFALILLVLTSNSFSYNSENSSDTRALEITARNTLEEKLDFENSGAGICGPNEEYTSCGPVYQHNCQNYLNPPRTRRRKCVSGCFCTDGYIRHNSSGSCVLPMFCDSSKMCAQNESFQLCGKECDFCDTNRQLLRRENCWHCSTGCYCNEGFVRNMIDNMCVSVHYCNSF